MLLFKALYRDDILSGRKTTTLRHWKRRLVSAGQTVKTNLGVVLAVDAVSPVALADITDAVAERDGFAGRADLLAALRSHYGELPETLTLVRFHVHGKANKV